MQKNMGGPSLEDMPQEAIELLGNMGFFSFGNAIEANVGASFSASIWKRWLRAKLGWKIVEDPETPAVTPSRSPIGWLVDGEQRIPILGICVIAPPDVEAVENLESLKSDIAAREREAIIIFNVPVVRPLNKGEKAMWRATIYGGLFLTNGEWRHFAFVPGGIRALRCQVEDGPAAVDLAKSDEASFERLGKDGEELQHSILSVVLQIASKIIECAPPEAGSRSSVIYKRVARSDWYIVVPTVMDELNDFAMSIVAESMISQGRDRKGERDDCFCSECRLDAAADLVMSHIAAVSDNMAVDVNVLLLRLLPRIGGMLSDEGVTEDQMIETLLEDVDDGDDGDEDDDEDPDSRGRRDH